MDKLMDDERIDTSEVALSTIDNPWNPFDHFNEWYAFDLSHGHGTLALLDRVLITSNELSEADQQVAYETAIDEIVKENFSGFHVKVYKKSSEDSEKG